LASLHLIRRALSHRNAQLFYGGSLIAATGLWMQRVAVAWLAWEISGSVFWVAVVAACDLVPAIVTAPLAGALADRVDRRRLTMTTQAVAATLATLLALLTATGLISLPLLIALELLVGINQSAAQPARQSLVPGLVPRADLPAAVALNSLGFNLSRFLGPALAGPSIAGLGIAATVAWNALAYLVALTLFTRLRPDPHQLVGHAVHASLFADAVEGVRYAARHAGIGSLLAYAALLGLLVRWLPEVFSPFIARIFLGGPQELAFLTSAMGLAALLGGLTVAARGQLQGLSRIAIAAGALLALACALFVATDLFWVALIAVALQGAGTTMHGISVQTLIQAGADPAFRGRVLSLWGLVIRAGPALGVVLFGVAAEWAGLRLPVLASAVLGLLAAGYWALKLPRIAAALEGAPPRPSGSST
jgi:MFS family permease